MNPQENKEEYVRLWAEGKSYSVIAGQLHISKLTCSKWERELAAQINKPPRAEFQELCGSYGLAKKALKDANIGTKPAAEPGANINAQGVVTALGDLLNRVRTGEVTDAQASQESTVPANLLQAYVTIEVKTKLGKLEAIIGGRQ